MRNSRRSFLKTMSVMPLVTAIGTGNNLMPQVEPLYADVPEKLGNIRIKTPKEFSTSPFGIGCETLDRELWDPKEIYPWMDDLPVKWARLQTGWARVEKTKGVYDWQWLDESVDGLLVRGFKPFFNVGYGNTNYTEGDTGFYPMITDEAYAAWKRFVKALTLRYRNKISHYEIWNEPNLTGFWKPGQVDPAKYVGLVRETAPIIRKHCKNAVIIGGVLSRLPYNYIRGMFDNGLADLIDIFSFHPYGVVPESYNDKLVALKTYIHQLNPAIKIWQGENGYASAPGSSGFVGEPPWTENVQAKIMLRRLVNDCSLGIDMTLWFLIVDIHDYPKGSGRVNYKGILRVKPEIGPKVAFRALQYLGSIVNGDVRVRNAVIHAVESNRYSAEEAFKLYWTGLGQTMANVRTTILNCSGGKVLAYWKMTKATDSFDAEAVDLLLWDWEATGMNDPVLVNPINGEISDLSIHFTTINDDNDRLRINHNAQVFQRLPLFDFPMMIADRKMVLNS